MSLWSTVKDCSKLALKTTLLAGAGFGGAYFGVEYYNTKVNIPLPMLIEEHRVEKLENGLIHEMYKIEIHKYYLKGQQPEPKSKIKPPTLQEKATERKRRLNQREVSNLQMVLENAFEKIN